jgi:hypothetical protein
MSRPTGNIKLKSARQAAGFASQQDLANALTTAGKQIGVPVTITERQVRRWESPTPPWPRAEHQRVLTHVLSLPIEELGFTAPWDTGTHATAAISGETPRRTAGVTAATGLALPLPTASTGRQPATVAADFAAITAAHRRLYWTVQPTQMHPTVVEHARLGTALLSETAGFPRTVLARALAETSMMQGRIEFFDLRKPDQAADTYVRALQAAQEAGEALLGAAILAHAAFVPGWAGERQAMAERMAGARAMARRAPATPEIWAWLDCVEAECETRCGQIRTALHLLGHAEDILADDGGTVPLPEWMDWFSPARLAAFKGNTQLKAGHTAAARDTLTRVLAELPPDSAKQRTVVLGDLAAVEAADQHPAEACAWALAALEQLAASWYQAGMDRVREVRQALQPWAEEECVRRLDDRLYGWTATVSALQR